MMDVPTAGPESSRPRRERNHPSGDLLRRSVSFVSFWAAIGLPAMYVTLLVSGIASSSELLVFPVLFGLHLLALLGGRNHHPGGLD